MATATVDRTALIAAVKPCVRTASTRSSIPILQCLRMETSDESLQIVGGDGERWAGRTVMCSTQGDDAVCVNAPLLLGSLEALNGQYVTLHLEGAALRLVSGRQQASIQSLDPDDYPLAPNPQVKGEIVASSGKFFAAVSRVRKGAVDIGGRPILEGIRVCASGSEILFSSTNTIIALRSRCEGEGEGSLVMTGRALEDVSALGFAAPEEVRISFSASGYRCERGGDWCAGGLLQGTFPNVDRVFPQESTREWLVQTDDVRDALRLIRAQGDIVEKYLPVLFEECGGQLLIRNRNQSLNSAKDTVEVIDRKNVDGYRVQLNGASLIDLLASAPGDTVRIEATDHERPVRFVCPGHDDWDAVQLPMFLLEGN